MLQMSPQIFYYPRHLVFHFFHPTTIELCVDLLLVYVKHSIQTKLSDSLLVSLFFPLFAITLCLSSSITVFFPFLLIRYFSPSFLLFCGLSRPNSFLPSNRANTHLCQSFDITFYPSFPPETLFFFLVQTLSVPSFLQSTDTISFYEVVQIFRAFV